MGLFDLFTKKKKAPLQAKPVNAGAAQEELVNHQRKSNFYRFAFRFLPEGVFTKPIEVVRGLSLGGKETLDYFLNMFVRFEGGTLRTEDIALCTVTVKPMRDSRECVVLTFPGAGTSVGKLTPVPAPYFVGIVFANHDVSTSRYYVLTEGLIGPTSLRELNAQKMNLNCGNGCGATIDEFVEALHKS